MVNPRRSSTMMGDGLTDFQFSLFHELENVGRMEYGRFKDDAAAMKHARGLVGDFDKVTVLEGARIVGVVLHPRHEVRDR